MENKPESTIQIEPRNGRRLVLFPMPFQGHINPMLQLAQILYTKGFAIAIIHNEFNSPNHSNYPHFTFRSIPGGFFKTKGMSSDFANSTLFLNQLNNMCAGPFHDCLAQLISEGRGGSQKEAVASVITDAFWYSTQAVAESLKVPRLVLPMGFVSYFAIRAALPLVREKGFYLSHQESLSDSSVPELPTLKMKDLPRIVSTDPESHCEFHATVIKETKAASGIIWNTFKELEQPALATIGKDVFPNSTSFPIGPFHKYFSASSSSLLAQDRTCISWLDEQAPKSVLYVSFGSLAALDESEFLEVAWGLANSMQPFLWVVRPGSIRGSEWLEPLPEGFLEKLCGKGYIVKWAPQPEVLAHPATGGFWTHNGWSSTLESICEGVPMICSPTFADQPVNARYVSDVWKIGVQLESGFERTEIESTIKRVMVEKEGEDLSERIMRLKEEVNLSIEKGGSSSESLESLVNYILSF